MWKTMVAIVAEGFSDVFRVWLALLAAPFRVLIDFIRHDQHAKERQHHTGAAH
jgi:hypothetical protein